VKKQSRVKRKELNKLLGYTVRHLKDKVSLLLLCSLISTSMYVCKCSMHSMISKDDWMAEHLLMPCRAATVMPAKRRVGVGCSYPPTRPYLLSANPDNWGKDRPGTF